MAARPPARLSVGYCEMRQINSYSMKTNDLSDKSDKDELEKGNSILFPAKTNTSLRSAANRHQPEFNRRVGRMSYLLRPRTYAAEPRQPVFASMIH
uniref:Uncharacterized protein n=1 Tax=Plectus sambesii TaxID=2011161 RepID=A0A914UPA8_9BILA